MDVTAEDFRRYYSSLSDEALLETDTAELVEVARACYAGEIARRGLDSPPPDEEQAAAPGSGSGKAEERICIVEYDYPDEAEIARGLLEAAGIPATIESDQAISMMNFAGAVSVVRLLVPASLGDQALQMLATPLSDEELAAQAEAAGRVDEDSDDDRSS